MDVQAASLIGAGLAAIVPVWPPSVWATCSVASSKARCASGCCRRPAGRLFIGFAAAELLGLLSFLIAILLYLKAADFVCGAGSLRAGPATAFLCRSSKSMPQISQFAEIWYAASQIFWVL